MTAPRCSCGGGAGGSSHWRWLARPSGSASRLSRHPGRVSVTQEVGPPVHLGPGQVPARAVGIQHVCHRTGNHGVTLVKGGADDLGNVDPADPTVEEGGHGHLVGAVEPGRSGAARSTGPVGQVQARERLPIRRLELERSHLGPVDGAERHPQAVGIGQCVPDREPHVGKRQLGQGGAVSGLDHGVHDRLGVHHYIDGVVADPEQLMGFDDLESLVHQRGRVDGDLRAHLPRRVRQGVVDGDLAQRLLMAAPERAAAGGQHHPPDRHRPQLRQGGHLFFPENGPQALMDGAVLGVHRHDLGARCDPGRLDDRAARDERLLVGQGQPAPRLQRGQRDRQAGEADHSVDDDVRSGRDLGQGFGSDK